MPVRLDKPWQPLAAAKDLPGQLGAFQLADADQRVLYVGYAGGRSKFGLRSAVIAAGNEVANASQCRGVITSASLTRYRELLMAHVADYGELPAANSPELRIGKLGPG